jgi:hypothetical protein
VVWGERLEQKLTRENERLATKANPGKWRWILRVACDAGIQAVRRETSVSLCPGKFQPEPTIKLMLY